MSAWDTELALKRAVTAYRYVADTLPSEADPAIMDSHTEAAYAAEQVGDWPAYVGALREMMRAAKREAGRGRAA